MFDRGGACPSDDIVEIDGFKGMFKISRLGNHSEEVGYWTWLGLMEGEGWDPAFCSIR
jgi:hypothetical protein